MDYHYCRRFPCSVKIRLVVIKSGDYSLKKNKMEEQKWKNLEAEIQNNEDRNKQEFISQSE